MTIQFWNLFSHYECLSALCTSYRDSLFRFPLVGRKKIWTLKNDVTNNNAMYCFAIYFNVIVLCKYVFEQIVCTLIWSIIVLIRKYM